MNEPYAGSAAVDGLKAYLQQLITSLSRPPDYFPAHLDFDAIYQSVRLNVQDSRQQKEDSSLSEAAQRAGYFTKIEQWQLPQWRWAHDHRLRIKGSIEWDRVREYIRRGVILGHSGFGKSWLLQFECRRVALEGLGRLQGDMPGLDGITLPIFLSLDDLAVELDSTNPGGAIIRILRRRYHLSEQCAAWMTQQISTSRCLLLLDGLDEVPQEQQSTVREAIKHLAEQYDCRILLTSRYIGYQKAPFVLEHDVRFLGPESQEIELLAFDKKTIVSFIERWFSEDKERADQLLRILHREPSLASLARIPFMLPLLCIVFSEDSSALTSRTKIYQAMLYHLMADSPQINESRKQYILYPTFHEYLMARSLAEQPFDQWRSVVQAHCWFDPDWLGTIILLAGCLVDPNPLLRTLLDEPEDAFHAMLLLAGRCLVEADKTVVQQELAERIISGLLTLLSSASRHDQEQAALIVEQIGRMAVNGLLKTLLDKQHTLPARRLATETLGWIGDGRVVEDLLMVLQDNKEPDEIKYAAALAPGRIGDPRAVKGLMDTLQDILWDTPRVEAWLARGVHYPPLDMSNLTRKQATQNVRQTIVWALGQIGDAHGVEILQRLVGDTEDTFELRREAARALAEMANPKAIEALVTTVLPSLHRWEAIDALSRIGEQAIEQLLLALQRKSQKLRIGVAHALGKIGGPEAITALLAMLQNKDENRHVRDAAAIALGNTRDPGMVAALQMALQDEDELVRAAAIWGLGPIGGIQTMAGLLTALRDKYPDVRMAAATVLGEIGDPRATAQLSVALRDKSRNVRETAASALGCIGGSQAVASLMKALRYKEDGVSYEVAMALAQIGSVAIPQLRTALHDERWWVRRTATVALGQMGKSHIVDDIISMVHDSNLAVRQVAFEALLTIRDARSVRALLEVLHEKYVSRLIFHTREEAEKAWREHGVMSTEEMFGHMARQRIVVTAVRTLGQIGDQRAVDPLLALLRDENRDTHVCYATVDALGRIGDPRSIPDLLLILRGEMLLAPPGDILLQMDIQREGMRNTAANALANLVHVCDPVDLCNQLLDACLQVPQYEDVPLALYELLKQLAPRLRIAVGDAWAEWRTRLVQHTHAVLNRHKN
jgi:HEAT repeat protein